jgi:Lamin Tail Domain
MQRYFFFFALLLLLTDHLSAQSIFISEILSDPGCPGDDCEYVEVKNPSGSITVDIGDWSVRDNESGMAQFYVTFPTGTMLAPGGTIIATKNLMAFNAAFQLVSCSVYELDCGNSCTLAGLANDGDFVGLYNSAGTLMHSHTYNSGSTRLVFDGSNWNNTSAAEADPCASTLPINLMYFSLNNNNNKILMGWRTASERNNAHFTIERSSDGRSFSEIGRLAGAGNSNETKTYTFTDERPLRGLNYYRLKQTDFDGAYTYSPIRSAAFGTPGRLTLSPSPANSWIHVQYEAPAQEEGVWQVFDAAGRILLSGVWEAENLSQDIELSGLPQGVYIFRLAAGKVFEARPFVAR